MAKAPKIFQRVIATANELRSGDVVFRTRSGLWSRDVALGYVAETAEAAAHLQAAADADSVANVVVEPALIPVTQDEGSVRPSALRERIRRARTDNRIAAQRLMFANCRIAAEDSHVPLR